MFPLVFASLSYCSWDIILSLPKSSQCLCLLGSVFLTLFSVFLALLDLFALRGLISTVLTQACFRPCKFVFSKQIQLNWTHVVCDAFIWAQPLFSVLLAQPMTASHVQKQNKTKNKGRHSPSILHLIIQSTRMSVKGICFSYHNDDRNASLAL